MNPVNEIAGEGLPQLWIKDLPPVTSVPLTIDSPGDLLRRADRQLRRSSTATSRSSTTRAGRTMSTPSTRATAASRSTPTSSAWRSSIRLGDINMLLSEYINSGSRLLFNRLIQERAKLVAPFLRYDSDPYVVMLDGKLYWIQDAYTVSDRYPYSEPVLDGHQLHPQLGQGGHRRLRRHHDLLRRRCEGSADPHLCRTSSPASSPTATRCRPACASTCATPRACSPSRRTMYRTYHMRDVNVFYNKEDQWNIPTAASSTSTQAAEPYYVIIRLPDQDARSSCSSSPSRRRPRTT